MKEPPVIVAEVSKSWPNEDETAISKLFEQIINFNLTRGYKLADWKYSSTGSPDAAMIETIIAVFERKQ